MTDYRVNTLAEMAAIPDEAMPRFIKELPALLGAAKVKMSMIEDGLVKDEGDFIWRDDGREIVQARIREAKVVL